MSKIQARINDEWIDIDSSQIHEWIANGRISSGTLVKLNGQTGLAGQIKGLVFPVSIADSITGNPPVPKKISKDGSGSDPLKSIPIAKQKTSETETIQEAGPAEESVLEENSSSIAVTSGRSSLFDREETILKPLVSQYDRPFQARSIDYKPFIHPWDRQAMDSLEAIPGLSNLSKMFLKQIAEKSYHGINLATNVRISSKQLPEIYSYLVDTCEILGIKVPELYLSMNPYPNAFTFGDTNPFITLTSGLVDLFPPEELKCVIAHECGHILCHHVLYTTLANAISNLGSTLISGISLPLQLGLAFWSRRSEFSADRVAAFVMGSDIPVIKTMLLLATGSSRLIEQINMEEYIKQTENYSQLIDESLYNKTLQSLVIALENHPFGSVRSREIRSWFQHAKGTLPVSVKNRF